MITILVDSLGSGGAQRQLQILAKALSAEYDLKIVCYNYSRVHYDIDENLITYFKRSFKSPLVNKFISLIWIIKNLKSTRECISFQFNSNLISFLSSIILLNFKPIVSERTDLRRYSRYQVLLNYLIYARAKAIVVNSENNRKFIVENFPERISKKVVVIHNGSVSPNFIKKDFVTNSSILYVGRINPVKNINNLIRAVIELRDLKLNLKIYGRADSITDKEQKYLNEFNELLQFARSHKRNIQYFGEVEPNKIPYSSCDCLISVSKFEGASNAVTEAISARCPVLSTFSGEHVSFIKSGLIYPIESTSVDSIVKSLNEFYAIESDQIKSTAINAQIEASRKFNSSVMIDKFKLLFDV